MLRFFLSRRAPLRLVAPPTLRARSFSKTVFLAADAVATLKEGSQDAGIRGKKSKRVTLGNPLTIPSLAISETVEAATLGNSIIATYVSGKDQPTTIADLIDKLPSEPEVSRTIVLFKESSTARDVLAFLRAQDRSSVELVDTAQVSEAARKADVVLISGLDTVTSALSCYNPSECKSLILCNFEPDATLLKALGNFNQRARVDASRTHYVPSSERTPIICLLDVEEKLNWSYERAVSFTECYFRTWPFPPNLSFLPANDGVNNLEDDFWTYITDSITSSSRTIIYTTDSDMAQDVYDGLYKKAVTASIIKSKDDLIYDQKIKAYIISADSTFFRDDIDPCGNIIIFHAAKSIEDTACGRNLTKRSARIMEVVPSDEMNFVSLSGIKAIVPIEIRYITPDLLTKVQRGHVPFPDEKDLRFAKRIQVYNSGAEQRLRSEVATMLKVIPKFAAAMAPNQVEAYVSGEISSKTSVAFGSTFFRQQQSYDSSTVQVKVILKEDRSAESVKEPPLAEEVEAPAAEEFLEEDEYGRVVTERRDRWGSSDNQDRYRSKNFGGSQNSSRRPERGSWDKQRKPSRAYDSDNRRPQKQGWEEGRQRQSWNNQERPPRTYGSDNRRPPKQDWEEGRQRQPWNNQQRSSSRSNASENGRGQSGWRDNRSYNGRGSRSEGTSWNKSER
ncbi:uncharacterized protein EV420DRAFT_1640848 [Desarmillaria tabescens]|uniref:Uncharacterized protein n=1 Tax=Armillaria tabescens TaxID=1929756 RepID=A0AA39TW55_ARMTA|nr:uncharacterized protein EV420DRAFT_1640848 [Desarmillaria tabescens]KAK0461370.1 hypothetical protein EV420DRAFT_1640848 [Desarmillaria tabescens]